jgi:hypothetical protein
LHAVTITVGIERFAGAARAAQVGHPQPRRRLGPPLLPLSRGEAVGRLVNVFAQPKEPNRHHALVVVNELSQSTVARSVEAALDTTQRLMFNASRFY